MASFPRFRPASAAGRFAGDRRGVAALEFAFIAPVMILLYFGLAEFGMGLMADRRADHAAAAIGDLTAQSATIYDSDVTNIFAAASTLMQPFDASILQLRITTMTVQANKTGLVTWSEVKNSSQGDLPPLSNCKSVITTIPANLPVNTGDSLIMAEAVYRYSSPVSYLMRTDFKFAPVSWMLPRRNAPAQRFKGAATTPVTCP